MIISEIPSLGPHQQQDCIISSYYFTPSKVVPLLFYFIFAVKSFHLSLIISVWRISTSESPGSRVRCMERVTGKLTLPYVN